MPDGEHMNARNQESIPNHGRALTLASRGRFFALAFLLVVLLISALAPEVHADVLAKPTNVVAREHQTTGNRYYRLREFEKAIEEYKAGAVREDAPVFYYNLGQCYRQLGRYEDAIWHYERFLERGKPTGEVEASVRDFIARMKGELEKKAMNQPPVEVTPSSPASPGKTLAAAPSTEGGRGMSTQRKIAITMGPAGLAVVGLGLGLGLRARSFKDDAAEICPMNPCARSDDANKALDRGKANARYANVALGVGGTAILGAVVFWISGSSAERKNAAIVPQVSRTFAGIAASLRF